MSVEKKQISTADIYNLLNAVNQNLTQKIDNIEKELKQCSKIYEEKVAELEGKVDKLEQENTKLKQKIGIIERRLRQNNIIIHGIPEIEQETTSLISEKIITVFEDNIGIVIDSTDISNIYRLGANKDKKRPLLLTLSSQIKRSEVFRNCKKLKGSGISITEDLDEESLKERRILVKHLREARQANKFAKLKGNKLYIEGILYTAEQLEVAVTPEETEVGASPVHRRAISEPSTPNTLDLSEPQVSEDTSLANKQQMVIEPNSLGELKKYPEKGSTNTATPVRTVITRTAARKNCK